MHRRLKDRPARRALIAIVVAWSASAGLAAGPALAQESEGPSGCLDYPVHRQFDF